MTTITPFGLKGPWAGRRGDELVTYAMGGIAYSTPGMPDAANDLEREPPLHPACFAAETITGLCAGLATLTAVLGRAKTQDGCHLDVSQQAAVASMQHRDVTSHSYLGGTFNRLLNPTTIGRMPNFYLPCKDGYVTIPAPMDVHWERLVEAMGNPAWALTPEFSTSPARTANWIELRMRLIDWTMTLSGAALYGLANQTQLPIFQFYPVRKLVESDQVRARDSVVDIEIGNRRAKMPGAPFAMRATPLDACGGRRLVLVSTTPRSWANGRRCCHELQRLVPCRSMVSACSISGNSSPCRSVRYGSLGLAPKSSWWNRVDA